MKKTVPVAKPEVVKQSRSFVGEVVAASAQKTIRVSVSSVKTHSKYRKQYSVAKVFAVHDESGAAKVGDKVKFVECRPISKTKKWRLIKVM